jgi:hypothetical protein
LRLELNEQKLNYTITKNIKWQNLNDPTEEK